MSTNVKEKVSLVSLGCPKNLVDAEVMLGYLSRKGFEVTTDERDADIIIVNTCSFIKEAKQESIDTILDLADRKHDARCRLLIVTGCLPQRYQEELARELPEVDIFRRHRRLPAHRRDHRRTARDRGAAPLHGRPELSLRRRSPPSQIISLLYGLPEDRRRLLQLLFLLRDPQPCGARSVPVPWRSSCMKPAGSWPAGSRKST